MPVKSSRDKFLSHAIGRQPVTTGSQLPVCRAIAPLRRISPEPHPLRPPVLPARPPTPPCPAAACAPPSPAPSRQSDAARLRRAAPGSASADGQVRLPDAAGEGQRLLDSRRPITIKIVIILSYKFD